MAGRIKLPANWTKGQFRVKKNGDVELRINPSALGSGGRFAKCVKSVEARGGASDAKAVCASAGRKKYGKKKFQAMAASGRRRKRNVSLKQLWQRAKGPRTKKWKRGPKSGKFREVAPSRNKRTNKRK